MNCVHNLGLKTPGETQWQKVPMLLPPGERSPFAFGRKRGKGNSMEYGSRAPEHFVFNKTCSQENDFVAVNKNSGAYL